MAQTVKMRMEAALGNCLEAEQETLRTARNVASAGADWAREGRTTLRTARMGSAAAAERTAGKDSEPA